MTNEKRIVDYREMEKLFDEQYKKTAELIRNGETNLDNLAEGFLEADRVIAGLPIVDAVIVVRCKDCRHAKMHIDIIGEPHLFCGLATNRVEMEFDDFCSYGERKEQNNV